MSRKLIISTVVSLGILCMSASGLQAQPIAPPRVVQAAPECCWHERAFAIGWRAHWFANNLERRGYIVQVNRVGLLQWSVRYRLA